MIKPTVNNILYPITHASQNDSNYFLAWKLILNNNLAVEEPSSASTNYYNVSDISQIDNYSNTERFVDLNELIDYRFRLIKPLTVKVKRDDFDFIGEIRELNIYAFGDSEFDVLREINKDVTELFEELLELDESQLGSNPLKWKKVLSEHIQNNID